MQVFRIQPQNAVLHGIETTTSNDEPAGGVHVFATLPEVYGCHEWVNEQSVELVTIECEKRDLVNNGDYEGVTLKSGRGKIVERIPFADIRSISEWVENQG